MMAASARTSGTLRPNSSIVKRGVWSSLSSLARAAARARASVARRARAVDAEYAFFLLVALVVAARAGVFCAEAAERVCADTMTGTDVIVTATTAKDTAIFVKQFCFAINKMIGL